ncbi:unnamed protein product [Rodentolepis nana]|uniref:Protein kinase domain-containing protein n=1 Tax=Rodentolepis nana TaxID=102285 RepID=A0A0R3T6G3_RODNA|nr:unnamed protein product [Rodentolepis nana]
MDGKRRNALSDYLSFCWNRKLASTDGGSGGGGRRRKVSSSQRQNASPKARGNVDGSCSTIQEESLRSAPSPARLSHRHRCCRRHHCYQHRYHHHHHTHRHHYHIHHHCQQHLHRCSRANAAVIGSGVFTTSRASSNSSTGRLNPQLPKLTFTPAEIAPASVCYRMTINNQPIESGASKQDALSVFQPDNFANEDKSPNRLMMTRRYRHDILASSILDSPTGDCSSLASSCSPCPGAIASYPSLFATSALSSPILPTANDLTSILLQFAEGISPKPPDGIDPSTPLHVMPSFHEMSPMRRKWRTVKIATKGLTNTSSTTAAHLDTNGVGEKRTTSRLKEEETFHIAEDALQFGMVHLVPCPHLMKAVVDPDKSSMYGRGHGQLAKVHDAGQKIFDLGPVSKLSHGPSQLSSHGHTPPHNHSTIVTAVTASSGGGSVSSFLSSGFRAVTSGFGRPRERRRSVSTPCGNEAPGNANNEGVVCGNTVLNTPSSSIPGSSRGSDFAHSICALPGSGISQLVGPGYSTDTASKASTPPFVTDEADGLCAANGGGGGGLNSESVLPCLRVASLSQMMQLASASNRRGYPYIPNQEENCKNSTETVTSSTVGGCQLRHWHLPTCPHRLCIPRQNLPPPPSLIRRHANNNFTSTGPHVSITSSNTQLEDHLSFRNSYFQHHHQSDSVAAQPPELRHLPVEHPRLHRQQPATNPPVSLSSFQGDRRSALDLPSYLETTSAAGVVCSTPAATADSRSTTCLSASSASQRLSPPPTSKSLVNTTTTVRKNKRTMLSLFGGRTTTSLSSNQHLHHQLNQHGNSHNPVNSAGTFVTGSGSGGASFPSTPVREPSSSSIVMATTSVQVNSPTPPLATNFTSFSSNSSSGGSSSVPAATNGNG